MTKVIPEQLLQISDELRRQTLLLKTEEHRLGEIHRRLGQMTEVEDFLSEIRAQQERIDELTQRLQNADRALKQISLEYQLAEHRNVISAQQAVPQFIRPTVFWLDGADVSDIPVH